MFWPSTKWSSIGYFKRNASPTQSHVVHRWAGKEGLREAGGREHITMTIMVAERTMVTIEMWMFMVAEAFVEYLSHPKISILGCEYLFE